ncbi:MAG: flagellar export chaperone FliS [Syntrophaceae bacterium]
MYGECIGAYRKAEVFTSDPRKLVIMCYEGAISNLRLARESYEARDYETKARALQKAYDIINELMISLNFEKGGAIAVNLDALYKFMIRQLMMGDLNRDMKAFDRVIGMLEELASAWKNMPPVQQQQPAAQPADKAGGQRGVVPFKQKEYPASQEIKTEKRVSV